MEEEIIVDVGIRWCRPKGIWTLIWTDFELQYDFGIGKIERKKMKKFIYVHNMILE